MYRKKSLKPSQKFLGQVLMQDLWKNKFSIPSLPNLIICIKFDFLSVAIFWNGCCTGNGMNSKNPNKRHLWAAFGMAKLILDSFGTDSESFKTFCNQLFLKKWVPQKINLFWKNGISKYVALIIIFKALLSTNTIAFLCIAGALVSI